MRRFITAVAKAMRLPRALRWLASWLENVDMAAVEARVAAERLEHQRASQAAYEAEMAKLNPPTEPPEVQRAIDWALAFTNVRTGQA
jgi:hypothetical protein